MTTARSITGTGTGRPCARNMAASRGGPAAPAGHQQPTKPLWRDLMDAMALIRDEHEAEKQELLQTLDDMLMALNGPYVFHRQAWCNRIRELLEDHHWPERQASAPSPASGAAGDSPPANMRHIIQQTVGGSHPAIRIAHRKSQSLLD